LWIDVDAGWREMDKGEGRVKIRVRGEEERERERKDGRDERRRCLS